MLSVFEIMASHSVQVAQRVSTIREYAGLAEIGYDYPRMPHVSTHSLTPILGRVHAS